jgi:hypothetical protein
MSRHSRDERRRASLIFRQRIGNSRLVGNLLRGISEKVRIRIGPPERREKTFLRQRNQDASCALCDCFVRISGQHRQQFRSILRRKRDSPGTHRKLPLRTRVPRPDLCPHFRANGNLRQALSNHFV